MADRMRVTSLIRWRITTQKVPGKNGYRMTMFARCGLLARWAQGILRNLLRSDTPTQRALVDVTTCVSGGRAAAGEDSARISEKSDARPVAKRCGVMCGASSAFLARTRSTPL